MLLQLQENSLHIIYRLIRWPVGATYAKNIYYLWARDVIFGPNPGQSPPGSIAPPPGQMPRVLPPRSIVPWIKRLPVKRPPRCQTILPISGRESMYSVYYVVIDTGAGAIFKNTHTHKEQYNYGTGMS